MFGKLDLTAAFFFIPAIVAVPLGNEVTSVITALSFVQ